MVSQSPLPFGVSPSLMLLELHPETHFYANVRDSMRLEELINAMLRECMRINANVRDYAIFYWRFCSVTQNRMKQYGKMCVVGLRCYAAGASPPPLLACGSTASCSAGLTVAAATKEPRAPKGVISHSCWYGPFSIYLCAISCLFISCCVYDEYAVMTICWGFCPFRFLLLQMHDTS